MTRIRELEDAYPDVQPTIVGGLAALLGGEDKTGLVSIPKAVPGLVFRYDYLRPHKSAEGVEHGKERPACILVTLKAGERLSGVTVIAEDGSKIVADYEATGTML